MTKLSPLRCVVALTILQGVAVGAQAGEWLYFNPLQGEVALGYTGIWNRNGASGSAQETEFNERIRLRQTGHILDSRIAAFSVGVEPGLTQREYTAGAGTVGSDQEILNYDASLRVLQGTPGPLGFSAEARRNTGTTDGGLGSQSEFNIESRTVAVNWKNRAFPTTLNYSETSTDQTFQSGLSAATSQRDDAMQTVTLSGRSSKLDVYFQRAEFDDRIVTRNQDSTTNTARLGHNLNWGKGSRLGSRLSYTNREGGGAPIETFSLDENVSIKHTENLSSAVAYGYLSTEQVARSTQHRGDFRLTHHLYSNLTTTANLSGSVRETEQVTRESQQGGGLNFAYRKRIPRDGRVTAGLGFSRFVTDRETINGLVSIVDEVHTVGPTTVFFRLNQRFVDQLSVIVTDSGTGLPYIPGADYLVVPVAGDLTEIQIVAGGAIAAAAAVTPIDVLASYDYQALPSQEFSATGINYSLGLEYGWIRLYHRQSFSGQERISGAAASFLADRRDSTTGMELLWSRGRNRATLLTELHTESIGALDTATFSIQENLTYILDPSASLSAGASQNFIESGGTDTDLYAVNLSVNWQPRYYAKVKPYLTVWNRVDKGATAAGGRSEEQFLSAGVDADFAYGRITLNTRYNHDVRNANTTESTQDRIMLTLKRKF